MAAIQALPKNSVGTKQLKKNAVVSAKVKNGSLLRADFKRGQIPAGPPGPPGTPGAPGAPGQQGPPGPFADVLPLSQAMRGDFAVTGSGGAGSGPYLTPVQFGFQLPAALGATQVHFIPVGGPVPAGCAGTAINPDAAAGHLCLFERSQSNRSVNGIFQSSGTAVGADRTGAVLATSNVAAGISYSAGTWAVRAPATLAPGGHPQTPSGGAPFGG